MSVYLPPECDPSFTQAVYFNKKRFSKFENLFLLKQMINHAPDLIPMSPLNQLPLQLLSFDDKLPPTKESRAPVHYNSMMLLLYMYPG